jgi:hypothetical protein
MDWDLVNGEAKKSRNHPVVREQGIKWLRRGGGVIFIEDNNERDDVVVTLLAPIQGVLCSNLGRNFAYPDTVSHGFPHFLQESVGIVPRLGPYLLLLPNLSFICHPFIWRYIV